MSSTLDYVWIPLLVVTVSISIATSFYLRRDQLCKSNYQQAKVSDKIPNLPEDGNLSISDRKILLVYDMNDEATEKKASLLRKQMIANGISIVSRLKLRTRILKNDFFIFVI